ncbi:MAG: hypothetical protein PW844_12130 [Pantoea sp.]|uniref:hypothetical protein n=1 Tax=Pantoea sp. TaxID=69393 RepID=UPI0023894515|nr:hypothetical protein [Pantoea sp.]MDE1187209.1 hypothetical protein [Pantoea sp.]
MDSYTLAFAALLLIAGSLCDLIGARMALGGGLSLFVLASIACGMAIAVFGAILAQSVSFIPGFHISLILAACLSLGTAVIAFIICQNTHFESPLCK